MRASPSQMLMTQREMKQGPRGSWAAGRLVAQDAGGSWVTRAAGSQARTGGSALARGGAMGRRS